MGTQENGMMEEGKILTQKRLGLHRLDFFIYYMVEVINKKFLEVIMKVCLARGFFTV